MIQVIIKRTYRADYTTGVVMICGGKFFSIEKPWRDNANNISCIPEGIYTARWTRSPRLKKFTYEITGVKNRSGIRIHAGNTADDSLGCPLLGMRKGSIRGKMGVLASREAVERFNRLGNGKPLTIEIKRAVERDFKG